MFVLRKRGEPKKSVGHRDAETQRIHFEQRQAFSEVVKDFPFTLLANAWI
jgi:hypothetical protein